jgi:predicted Rossmann fold nucleotide-binding protein DprA/Smf involved in DNA uptake
MKVGFTGTREETTPEQHHALCQLVQSLESVTEWHHGACIGADAEGIDVACEHAKGARRIAHPPENRAMVSLVALDLSDEVLDPLPYLERNRAIVDACDVLIACPKGPEELRSGTWSTVRYARKQGKRVVIIWPDGKITEEGGDK